MPQHFFKLIAGDRHEGAVHMHDQPLVIGDQHAFTGAIEHGGRLAQTLAVFTSFGQFRVDTQATQQSRPDHEDQAGAHHHPGITVDQLPA
ncbi:hypothetical protein D3C73_924200 [compost metagenome]